VTLAKYDFRSQVLRRTTKGESARFDDLGEPKVRELEVPIFRDEQVFCFEVPKNDVLFVDVLEDEDNLRCVESGLEHKYAACEGSNLTIFRR
jgi:hypothetical protein